MSKIRSLSFLLMMLAGVALSGPVQADDTEIDMTKVTCKQASEAGPDFFTLLIFWVDGYLSKEQNDPMFGMKWLNELGGIVKDGCAATPNESLLNVVRKGMK